MPRKKAARPDAIKLAGVPPQVLEARERLLPFVRLMMPDPEDYDNFAKTSYQTQNFHAIIAEALERVERGELKRLAISVPPQHGKSQLCSRMFPAWYMGRHPDRALFFAAYSNEFSGEFGAEARDLFKFDRYQLVFPDMVLQEGSQARSYMVTKQRGRLAFIGRKGAGTGKPADMIIIDDPIKNAEEAESPTTRRALHEWFSKVVFSRAKNNTGIVIIQCMTGDTPVLLPCGAEKPLRDIRPGERVATYDNGALRTSVVEKWASQGIDRVFTIKTKSGIVVRANARHPFLTTDGGGPRWTRTRDLRPGHAMFRVNGENGRARLVATPDAISPSKFEDTAFHTTTKSGGLTEFARRLRTHVLDVTLTFGTATASLWKTTNAFLQSRAESALSVVAPRGRTFAPIGAGNCASIIATTLARCADFSATTAIWPLDTQKPRKSLQPWLNTSDFVLDEIVEISDGGCEEVFDIQVAETENFIANGLVSHNTRWHEDDLIGRLCDPDHPNYDKELAGEWTYVNIPAVVQEGPIATILNLKPEPSTDPLVVSQFGAGPIASLWPERFSLRHLATAKKMNPLGFDALYQGKPSPDDGEYFRAEWLVEYDKNDLPEDLRYYGASDHAVDEKQRSDKNVIGCVGVDPNDTIWVMPDVVMAKGETDVAVEDIIAQMQRYKPFTWYMESELISKSFGPFLRKRMEETKTYCHVQSMPVTKRKEVRARAIQGRLAMKKVRFPKFAPWWREARAQLLKFPFGAHDDFVDWLAHFGMGLSTQISAESAVPQPDERVVRVGSIEWIMRKAALRARMEQRQKAAAGW